jgi:guanylate cyclase soluble subunit beta
MVIDHSGSDAWERIENRVDIGPEHLVSAQVYDDELTVALLAMAAEQLGSSVSDCLKAFGRYWIRFAERGSYGAMMDFTGRDIATFIGNLDRMHQAVQAAMPEARVPSFRLVEQSPECLKVQYRSEREGLEPFVIGLLEGLLDRFETAGSVEMLSGAGNAAEFAIHIADPASA